MSFYLSLHIVVGFISLLTGFVSIISKKGQKIHIQFGKVYFYAMTCVFITGIILAGYTMNKFLFLIAFLSYYSVFSGVRILKLKNLHKNQKAKWFDWFAGYLNAFANLVFIVLGIFYILKYGLFSGATLLTLGFGIGGLFISYINLKPFYVKPDKHYHWYLSHIGNMMGGYIATFTAFLSTLVSSYHFINPFLAFALPSIIGVPFIIYWLNKTEKQFNKKSSNYK